MTYIAKRVRVKHNDVDVAYTNSVNFLDGTNASFTVNDDMPNEHVDVQVESTGGGGSGSTISGTAVLNFGAEKDKALNTVASAVLTTSNIKSFTIIPQGTTETSLEDFKLNGVTFNIENIINNTSFDIRGTASKKASGNYTIKYIIIY
jgi:hypothetical protein